MVKMEERIISRVNPYVGARFPVHCSCCDSEVKPAITIEKGYAVEAISLVQAVDPANETKPPPTVTITEINNDILVEKAVSNGPLTSSSNAALILETNPTNHITSDSDEYVRTMNMLSNTKENASEDRALEEDASTTSMNISIKDSEDSDENTGETEIKKPVTEIDATGILDDPVITVQENCVEEQSSQSGDELDTSDEFPSSSSENCMFPPRVCRNIRLALDKARFCLQKINCATTKRYQELYLEQNEHIKAIKKLAEEGLAKHDSGIVEELYLVNQELIKSMEYLKEQMLDCQHASLLDIIATLKQDVDDELSSFGAQYGVQENQQESKRNVETSDSLMTFLKDSSWTSFGFISLVVANLGYFTQPWLLESFHACFVRYLDYFRNSVTFQ